MSTRNAVLVAAAALVLVVFASWLAPWGSTGSFAFAQVQQQVEKTKSVQYIQRRKDSPEEAHKSPEETRKVMILGSHRKREEVRITAPGDPLPAGQFRGDIEEPYVMIYDARTGKEMTLFPEKRGYAVPRETMWYDDNNQLQSEEYKPTPKPKMDFYGQIRAVPSEKAKRLPDRQIGKRAAAGFQVVEKIGKPRGAETWTRTYWVDPETKLPVRIETSHRSTDPMMAGSDWVQSDIVFDAPLDESLFSTDPPKGYKDLVAEAEKAAAEQAPKKPGSDGRR